MATTPDITQNPEGPEGLIFLPEDGYESTTDHSIDHRETRELPVVDFMPVTDYPEREFGDHYAKIAMGRDYARGLTLDQQMTLYHQLQDAKIAYECVGQQKTPVLSRVQGALAVGTLVYCLDESQETR